MKLATNTFYKMKSGHTAYIITETLQGNFAGTIFETNKDEGVTALGCWDKEGKSVVDGVTDLTGKTTLKAVAPEKIKRTEAEADYKPYQLKLGEVSVTGPYRPQNVYNSLTIYLAKGFVPDEDNNDLVPLIYKTYVYKENEAAEMSIAGIIFDNKNNAIDFLNALRNFKV